MVRLWEKVSKSIKEVSTIAQLSPTGLGLRQRLGMIYKILLEYNKFPNCTGP